MTRDRAAKRSPGWFVLCTVILMIAVVEMAAWPLLWWAYGTPVAWRGLTAKREAVAAADPDADLEVDRPGMALPIPKAIHPFIGYVSDPHRLPKGMAEGMNPRTRDLGFPNRHDLIRAPDEGEFVVAVTGGSVAWDVAHRSERAIAEVLEASPALAGKRVIVLSLAGSGFKQPQQLMSLSYFLMLGARFDAVVNLDGFNDVALAPIELQPVKALPFYPRAWYHLTVGLGAEERTRMGEVSWLRTRRSRTAGAFDRRPWRYSLLAGFLWTVIDRRSAAKIGAAEEGLRTVAEGPNYQATGPRYPYRSADLIGDLVLAWERSSRQMHHLCRGLGIEYVHALQPNQYLPDSKPIGEEERAVALSARHLWRDTIRYAYPRLAAAGAGLRDEGVEFVDLTRLFRDHPEPLYRDNCCHLNQQGNDLLGAAVAARVRTRLEGRVGIR